MPSTFKAPTGAKHDRCIDHVPHPFPKSGKLCIGPTIGREGMIAFADEMAAKTAAHRAAFLAERPERPESWYIGTGKARRLRPIGEFRGHPVVPSVCDGTRCHESSVHAHGGTDVFAMSAGSHAGIAEQAARFNARRGRTVEPDTYVAAVARKAIERVGRASMSKREAARRASVEREARAVAPAPEPVTEPSRCWTYLHTTGGTRRCMVQPDHHDGPHDYEPFVTSMSGEVVPVAPEPVEEAPVPESEPAVSANVGALFAVGGALHRPEPSTRPTCERCGQSFRKSGNGLAWHVANRPDCAERRLSVVA